MGIPLAILLTTTPQPKLTTLFSSIPSSPTVAKLSLNPENTLVAGDKGSISLDQGRPPAESPYLSHMTLHDLPWSPLCLPFHFPYNFNLRLRTSCPQFTAVFLSSVLLGCVQLNTGSRGRCWPRLVGSHIPGPDSPSSLGCQGPALGGGRLCLCLTPSLSPPMSLQGIQAVPGGWQSAWTGDSHGQALVNG